MPTGFVSWTPTVKGYAIATGNSSPLSWSADCQPCLDATKAVVVEGKFFVNLATLWGQESGRTSGITELRIENVMLIKALGMVSRRPLSPVLTFG